MSKNDIPEVEITEFEKLEFFVTKNVKSIVIGACLIVGVAAVFVVASDQMETSDEKSMSVVSEASSEEELKAVIIAVSGHKSVVSAQLKLAKMYLTDKKYDEVKAVYATILKSSAIDSIKNRIKLNTIALDEVQGNIDSALAAYQVIGADMAMSKEVRAEANYSVARLLVSQDKKDDAKVLLSALAAETSAWQTQADQMLKRL